MYYREKNVIQKSRNKEGGPPKKNPLLFFSVCAYANLAMLEFILRFASPPGGERKREREGKKSIFPYTFRIREHAAACRDLGRTAVAFFNAEKKWGKPGNGRVA